MLSYIQKNKITFALSQPKSTEQSKAEMLFSGDTIQTPYGPKPIHFTDYQCDILSSVEKYETTIVLHGRQVGVTTVNLFAALSHSLFNPSSNVVFLCLNQRIAIHHANTFKQLCEQRTIPCTSYGTEIYIPLIDSKISFISNGARTVFKGKTVDFLIVEEAAYITNLVQWLYEARAACVPSTKLLITSGANKAGHYFAQIWYHTFKNCRKIYIPKTSSFNGDYNQQMNSMREIIGEQKFKQEYFGEFVSGKA